MGRTERNKEERKEVNSQLNQKIEKVNRFSVSKDMDFSKARNESWEKTKEMSAAFDKSLKSRWTPGSTKFNYEMFQMFIETDGITEQNIVSLIEWVNYLKEAVIALWEEVQQIKGVDIENMNARMRNLLNEPAIQIVEQILTKDQEAIKKINERREKLIKQSVV